MSRLERPPSLRGPARLVRAIAALPMLLALAAPASAQETDLPAYLADRGRGIATSLFGTYVEAGEFVVYPFYEYTKTSAFEYKPKELGYPGGEDYLGKLVERESLLFLSYGISDRVIVELEGAVHTRATFEKAPDDPSTVPDRLEESGLGDVQAEVRWRWSEESAHRPELFSFVEVVFPFQKSEKLIGTHDWEADFGFGVIRGYRWGTITGRVALAYDGDGNTVELGEYGFEYLKRVSPHWRLVAALEGESDELAAIGEAQLRLTDWAYLKLNCGFGISEKAPDVAPEVGLLMHF